MGTVVKITGLTVEPVRQLKAKLKAELQPELKPELKPENNK